MQAAEVLPPDHPATHEIGPLQHAHVLGRGGEGHAEGRGQFAQVPLPAGELPDDRASRRVGQCVEDAVESWGSIKYHVVYYTAWFYNVKTAPYAATVAVVTSDHGPFSPRALTQRRASYTALPASVLNDVATEGAEERQPLAFAIHATQTITYLKQQRVPVLRSTTA